MQFLRGLSQIPTALKDTVITIGSYDGIHLGHQAIINEVCDVAKQRDWASIVVSFNPYPKEFFKGERVPRLMSWREKYLALQALGVDYFLLIKFDYALSNMSAEDFVRLILVERLRVKKIIIGDDFRFGKNRLGDYNLLVQLGKANGFSVAKARTCDYLNERVSSSRTRHTLQAGNMDVAHHLLGHYYYVWGTVVHGNKLGRELGFPTANISLHRRMVPLHGIYVVRVTGIDEQAYFGVANIGNRPAVGGTQVLLEVFIFDFSKTIYGMNIKVEFLHKLRDEENYQSLQLLSAQIKRDVEHAKAWIARFCTR